MFKPINTIDAENTILKIPKVYGELYPKIKVIKTTKEKNTNKPIYIVSLTGNFVFGEYKSRKLQFSITEYGKKVRNLKADVWDMPVVNIN